MQRQQQQQRRSIIIEEQLPWSSRSLSLSLSFSISRRFLCTDSYYFRSSSFFRIQEELLDRFKHTHTEFLPVQHIMPNFAQAVPLLLASFAMTSPATTTTTTTVVAASSVVSSLERRVSNNKSNKKQSSTNKHNDDPCTMEPFLGTSHYTNCALKEIEVKIACDYTDDTATATTKKICSYSEQPVPFDDVAAAVTAVGCGDHGFFDPETHLIKDHVTGVCRLNFVALTYSCDAEAGASSKFGVMIEVLPSTGTSPHNHEHNEDKNHKNNSGMLLRFSHDAGATYYNYEDPRITGPLKKSSSRRKLDKATCSGLCACRTDGYFDNYSRTTTDGKKYYFQTCYKSSENGKQNCWSHSYRNTCEWWGQYMQCKPKDYFKDNTDGSDTQFEWRAVPDSENIASCGDICENMYHFEY